MFQFHVVGVLNVVRLLIGLAINVDNVVLNLKSLPRQSHTTLHIVLTTVSRTCVYQSVFLRVLLDCLSASLIDGAVIKRQLLQCQRIRVGALRIHLIAHLIAHLVKVISLVAWVATDGITCRVVEHHDVVELNLAQALDATIVPMGPLKV